MTSPDDALFPPKRTAKSPADDRLSIETLGAALLEFFRDAVIVSTPASGPIDCNRAALEMFGFDSKEELFAFSSVDLSPPCQPDGSPSAEAARRHKEKAAFDGFAQFDWVHKRKDGSLFDAEVSLRVVAVEDNLVAMAAIRDVTVQKKSKRDLQLSENRHRTLFDSAYDPIFLYDFRSDAVIDVNQKACALVGYSREELIEKDAGLFFWSSPPHTIEDGRRIARKIRKEGPLVFDWRARHKSGREFWVEVSAKRIELDERDYLVLVMRDVDDKKKLLQELAQAKENADMANRAKSAFLANISHEIRTPMNAIVGMTHLLSQTPLSDKQREHLSLIENASGNLSTLINDILDFSQIDTGNIELEETDLDFESVFAHLFSFSKKAQSKNVDLIFDVAPDLPRLVRGDPVRLGQILSNLVDNAIKFTERGQIVVTADMIKRGAHSASFRFRVTDSGIGISKEQLATIFEPFTQADGSITRQYGGSGLGLSICRKLAEKMGGRLTASSEKGRWSAFELTVEFRTAGPPSSPGQSFSGWNAAVAIAHPALRRAVVRALSPHFDEVIFAGNAAQVASRLGASTSPVRVVIFDDDTAALSTEAASKLFDAKPSTGNRPVFLHLASKAPSHKGPCCFADAHVKHTFLPPKLIERITKATDAVNLEDSKPQPAKTVETQGLQGMRILVVEDSETNRQVAQEILNVAGASYCTAVHGGHALDILREDEAGFDAVLMDVQMPVMDGHEATRAIRTRMKMTELPIIAMTADASLAARQSCLMSGMDDYISKPIRVDELYDVLRRRAGKASRDRVVYINVDKGLEQIGRKPGLYADLLEDFVREYQHSGRRIRSVLDAGDIPAAKMLTHTLKGSAGTIRADALIKASIELEVALSLDCEDARRRSREFLKHLDVTLQNTVRASRRVLGSLRDRKGDPAKFGSCDFEIEKLLKELGAQIADHRFTALETCEKLRQKLTEPKQVAVAWELTKRLKVFDYTAASRLLEKLRSLSGSH